MVSTVLSKRRKYRYNGRCAQREGGVKTRETFYLQSKEDLGLREKRPGTDSLSRLLEGALRMLDLGLRAARQHI